MTTNRARQARRYGHRVEQRLADRYDLTIDQDPMHDAVTDDGDPVEIKSCKRTLSDGRKGVISIRRQSHEQIREADGYYALAVYRPRGSGVEILDRKMLSARAVRVDSGRWQSISGKQDRAQIRFTELF